MLFHEQNNKLIFKKEHESITIESWGKDALRVKATLLNNINDDLFALEKVKTAINSKIIINEDSAEICNGKISAKINSIGQITFYKNNTPILKEFFRIFGADTPHAHCMALTAREYKRRNNDLKAIQRFESNDEEKIYGMGQYQMPYLDLKGCNLELVQRNGQITIPFYMSSLGYGFLWNRPAIGYCNFGKNMTEWCAESTDAIDYWITVGDTPKEITEKYIEATGKPSLMPEDVFGLWQSKLRYRTQEELLEVAREYKRRNIKLDVIVIDFFHWLRQGDWDFDTKYWPDAEAMVKELKEMGIRCMVSVWPTVEKKSVHYKEMLTQGMLVSTKSGAVDGMEIEDKVEYMDATNPMTREYVWQKCKETYYKYGIDMFWLDVAEPEYRVCDYDNYIYYLGSAAAYGNIFPQLYAKAFYDGMKEEGQSNICNLARSAWVGSRKYSSIVWSGDINGNFESFKDQLAAGLNIGIAGIPWWTTDIGGFYVDVTKNNYNELHIRWFQFAVFCPILRLHGNKGPLDTKPLDDRNYGGGFCPTGKPNEPWSYGDDVYNILLKYINIRQGLKEYIKELNIIAHDKGYPIIRPMFYEFPQDKNCGSLNQQYMFGYKYLVAPVMEEGKRNVNVYLPKGRWKNFFTLETIESKGEFIKADAPLDIIPVFELLY